MMKNTAKYFILKTSILETSNSAVSVYHNETVIRKENELNTFQKLSHTQIINTLAECYPKCYSVNLAVIHIT